MKKLFGREKQPKQTSRSQATPEPIGTPIHAQHAIYQDSSATTTPNTDSEKWEMITQLDNSAAELPNPHPHPLPPGASPPAPRSSSPLKQQQATLLKKKDQRQAPPALGILRSLDPHPATDLQQQVPQTRSQSEERERPILPPTQQQILVQPVPVQHTSKDKKNFWGKERGEKLSSDAHELTRMIGYLTATSSDDWALVLEVCDRASSSESLAKEAVRALRREFKYGEPSAQLSAARLWAIMLRNSSNVFIGQCTTRKFLDTIEDLLMSPRTSPVVRERVLDVTAAAAYASGSSKDSGFKALWRKVKPPGKPDEGVPFESDDSIFSPTKPKLANRHSQLILPPDHQQLPPQQHQQAPPQSKPKRQRHSQNRIIPREEDIRRLFQECKIGSGNASLLSQALVMAKPEDLHKKDVIKEFHVKCRSSQELICAQIDWATAEAERSRAEQERKRKTSDASMLTTNTASEETIEEQLLGALLAANAELLEALQQYEDLERVGIERETEDRSRNEIKMDRRLVELEQQLNLKDAMGTGGSRSRNSSPSPPRSRPVSVNFGSSANYSDPAIVSQTLALPPAAPAGPRSPASFIVNNSTTSRTPSPGPGRQEGLYRERLNTHTPPPPPPPPLVPPSDDDSDSDLELQTPIHPSAKALGKRRDVNGGAEEQAPYPPGSPNTSDFESPVYSSESDSDSEDERNRNPYQYHLPPRKPQFVYDAAAERTKARLERGRAFSMEVPVNGAVH